MGTKKKKEERDLKTFRGRLGARLDDKNLSAASLGKKVKASRASISDWLSGKTKNPRLELFFRACDYLEVRPRYLALGDYPMEPQKDDSPPLYTQLIFEIADKLSKKTETAQRKVLGLIEDLPDKVESPTTAKERLATTKLPTNKSRRS